MFQNIPLSEIEPNPNQPRDYFAGIEELAESIKMDGLVEPIMVRPIGERFQIVHGERRYRAAREAGLSEIPALVREINDDTAFRLSVVENVQRSNLTPMEEAASFARLQEAGHTQAEIGRIIGKGQTYVAHKLRLLKVPEALTYYLSVGLLTENHFRQAMRLRKIVGEEIRESYSIGRAEPRDLKATAISLITLRPYGRSDTALPFRVRSRANLEAEAAVIEGVNRFWEYVSKHNPAPAWERMAFWYLSAAVGYEWTVADIGRYIDDFERLIYSQVVWYSSRMKDKDAAGWDRYNWAVYHDLKHAGLLGAVYTDSEIVNRAISQLGREGLTSLIVPTELQDADPFWDEPEEKPTSEKTLEELEDSISRSLDKITGGCVQQAEAFSEMYRGAGWKELGFESFGAYAEQQFGIPAEAVMGPDGEIRPRSEMAKLLDEWSPSTGLAEMLSHAAHNMEREKFLEMLADMAEPEYSIPVGAVIGSDGKPYAGHEIARHLHADED